MAARRKSRCVLVLLSSRLCPSLHLLFFQPAIQVAWSQEKSGHPTSPLAAHASTHRAIAQGPVKTKDLSSIPFPRARSRLTVMWHQPAAECNAC